MTFLGKISLETAGQRLGVKSDGKLAMLTLNPEDPAGMFLAYDVGSDQFSLQAHTGSWVYMFAGQSPIAWYPVLYAAQLGSPTRFQMKFLDIPNRTIKLAFRDEDGKPVALLLTGGGLNPNCRCEFDVSNGWDFYGQRFGLGVATPGVPEIQRTKSAAGSSFACLGKACIDLSGTVFTDTDFRDAGFPGTKLKGVTFSKCNLLRTKFGGADLESTDFRASSIAGTDFSKSDLTKGALLPEPPFASDPAARTLMREAKVPVAMLKKNWSYLDLTSAEIVDLASADLEELVVRYTLAPGLPLSGRNLQRSDFSHSDLTRTIFQEANLTEAKFHSGTVADCFFTRATLPGAQFGPDPLLVNAAATDLTGARFSGANLASASFEFAMLWRTVFTAADLDSANFTSAQLGGLDRNVAASLSYAYMANVKLDKANVFGVNFAYVTLFGAATSITQTATMEQADFSNAYLAGINLSEANLKGAKFTGACLVNVRMVEVDLQPTAAGSVVASLAGATLQGVDFTGAHLNHADLSNAGVAFAQGQMPVRYCDQQGQLFPPPPDSMPLRFGPTVSLNLITMGPDTKCPNGFTVSENEATGKTLQQMLTSANAPVSWFAVRCGPAFTELGGPNLLAKRVRA